MNERPPDKSAADAPGARGQQLRQRFDQLSRSRPQALLRWQEIIGLSAAALMLLAVGFAYFSYLVPARERRSALQVERDDLQRRLREVEAGAKRNSDAEAAVVEIRDSLRSFEGERLSVQRGAGRTAMIQELNDLMASNNLRQVSSISFTALNAYDAAGKSVRVQQGKDSEVYPGLGITLSVEGAYQNLRRFVRDVEASKQFITIRSVQLEGADDRATQRVVPAPDGSAPTAAGPAALTLRLGMVAYFQREAAPASDLAPGQSAPAN